MKKSDLSQDNNKRPSDLVPLEFDDRPSSRMSTSAVEFNQSIPDPVLVPLELNEETPTDDTTAPELNNPCKCILKTKIVIRIHLQRL